MAKSSGNKSGMTTKAAARIASSTARSGNGMVPKDSFSSRATRAAAKNIHLVTKTK